MAETKRQTVRDLRRANRAALLRHLYFHGPLSRHELGLATGLSSGTVSNVTADLLADGLLCEAGSVESDGGRPRTLLRVDPDCGRLIGVDVGETRVRVELFDVALRELTRAEHLLPDEGHDVELVVRHIGAGVAAVLEAADTGPDRLLGVGVGVPGIVERGAPGGAGAIVHGQTIGWDAVPLEALLRSAVDLPARVPFLVGNGARTFGQAEMWFGAGRGSRDAVIALLGSGVGACIVTGGVPYGGADSAAGEWGHTTLRVGGRRCRCGARGCLEAYVGAGALLERWAEAGGEVAGAGQEAALAALLAAAQAADERGVRLLEETAEYLGAGIADLVNLFNPEKIVLGGWAGLLLGPHLLPAVREAADAYALRHPAGRTTIELGRLGPDAVTVGAATLPLADFLARGGCPEAAAGASPR
ncbi:ROK family transcriptional regulator [Streptomyces litchfieldiae]|uniref:ROK family transcriptional regulator n=1 Tax=Streptomyces litchfieldiae TaxID=3075543 RepID=A0ABU2MRT5_9ACTN|nr:ROK family transcriptional regulator [Streptomyces sp. DSM 44938]MDT0344343.1 ROK family transcriptional regulator [Streptomyces sp. DSM 44938]